MTNLSNIGGFDLLRSFRKILYNFKKEEKDDWGRTYWPLYINLMMIVKIKKRKEWKRVSQYLYIKKRDDKYGGLNF